ncbi:Putative phosphinothricin acetyltransferase YwnH [Paenibacillus sp. JJ-100]|uniref:GNAT family N-acetyltransferase n=1 Tax=Paenibacillus sp. JJ-100 TaxID=2974896 RepID=UPI0022FFA4E6|nr:GNAT family N-acetyltransferase [Paenibacillus sp. JJ-100]CAI6082553.1 Putative phosphinothricin acetyltransferase YwnH [Paenibacillus sp. JJ-100]
MQLQKVRIEYASLEDLPRIVEIYNSTIDSRMVTADLEPVTVEQRLSWFNEHTPDRRPLWVMKLDEQVVAWASLSSFYGRPAYNGTVEVSIYVDQKCRGIGAGGRLLETVFEACPALGITTVLGFVFGHNEPSLGLLRKYGFEQWGFYPEVAVLDGVNRDLVILGKKIEAKL